MAQPPTRHPEAGEPGGTTAGAAVGESSTPVPRMGLSSTPAPRMGVSSTPAPRMEQSSTPVPRMGLSSTPTPRTGDSTTRGPQVGDSSTPGAQMEQPATLVVKMEAPATSHVRTAESTDPFTQMEEAGTPATRMEGPASPSQPPEETTNPFTRRGVPTARPDLSRLYPPLPRGDYTPSHIAQPGDPGPRDDYFVLRPGTIEEAVKDVSKKLAGEQGQFNSRWILTEVDHWNRESERLLIIAERSLLVCQYDFIGLYCNQILCVPLHYIDTITLGPFAFPEKSLSRRDGTGLRIQWDKHREPSFLERWNPWSSQMPALVLTEHPAARRPGKVPELCQLHTFRMTLTEAVQRAHEQQTIPGRANGVLQLEQPIRIDTYLGLLSSLTNGTQLGYSKPRGLFGF